MKDQLIAILEAMRLSQAALARHFRPGGPNALTTLKELHRLLQDQNVVRAMEALYPNVESCDAPTSGEAASVLALVVSLAPSMELALDSDFVTSWLITTQRLSWEKP